MPLTAGISYTLHEGGEPSQKPMILVHGAGGSHLDWHAEFRRLKDHTVYAIDLPGHGRSTAPACQSVAAYAEALLEFLAALGRFQAVFVGHSLGAAVALHLALEYPQHVSGLGLFAAAAWFDVPPILVEYLSSTATAPLGIRLIAERLQSSTPDAALAARSLHALKAVRSSVLYGDWLACARFDIREQAARVQCPAYLACGAQDRLTPPAQSRFLAACLPLARLDVLPDAGHLLTLEQPALLAARLRDFLASLADFPARQNLPLDVRKKDPAKPEDK
ncbi:MAG: alpha/beta fold hydrolase [Chloroflexota bacterium]|jgi:pimeloyl-ACP methyl ester carboxylesterase